MADEDIVITADQMSRIVAEFDKFEAREIYAEQALINIQIILAED